MNMGWLADYTYRKPITLSRASGAVTNYQMKLLVGESSGATGENVDCGGKCKTDFLDLRFTTDNGVTLLDYWIESISGETPNQLATVWIEFDSIGTGATDFYMYYGKADASAVSNGVNTFILFDDFEWGINGTDIVDSGGGIEWLKLNGFPVISTEQKYGGTRSMKLPYSSTFARAYFNYAPSSEISVMHRFYKENASTLGIFFHGNGTRRSTLEVSTAEKLVTFDSVGKSIETGLTVTPDAWQLIEINNFNWADYKYSCLINGSAVHDIPMQPSIYTSGVIAVVGDAAGADRDSWIDNIIIRNWRPVEPAWGAWGDEEEEFLKIYSEATIKTQGNYAIKCVATQTTSLDKTRTRTLSSPIDLSDVDTLYLDIRASRTGSNIKIGLRDSGGTTTEITPNIVSADTFQQVTWDISGVANADKDAIDKIIITVVNADAENTFYIDNFYY